MKKNLTIVWGGPWPPVAPPGSATGSRRNIQQLPTSAVNFLARHHIRYILSVLYYKTSDAWKKEADRLTYYSPKNTIFTISSNYVQPFVNCYNGCGNSSERGSSSKGSMGAAAAAWAAWGQQQQKQHGGSSRNNMRAAAWGQQQHHRSSSSSSMGAAAAAAWGQQQHGAAAAAWAAAAAE